MWNNLGTNSYCNYLCKWAKILNCYCYFKIQPLDYFRSSGGHAIKIIRDSFMNTSPPMGPHFTLYNHWFFKLECLEM